MCEQTEVQYLDGDVVWVKLGPCWWPGQVKDYEKLPPDVTKGLKKRPLAVVQFFGEDSYEYVKNYNQIYKYNCRKKNEFIKKGLDLHRAKNAYMDKFPSDVCTAESLTDGDPDIITNEMFLPDQKPSYHSIFGNNVRKTPKASMRGRPSTAGTPKSASSTVTPERKMTHPRFLGRNDHEITILEQSTPSGATSHYTCYICGFQSSRINVIMLHNKSHSTGTYESPSKQRVKRSYQKKPKRMTFSNTASIDEDLQLIRGGQVTFEDDDLSESDEEVKNASKKRKNNKKENNTTKKVKTQNVYRNMLLADWVDSDSNEQEQTTSSVTVENRDNGSNKNDNNISNLLSDWNDDADNQNDNETVSSKEGNSSCFDFKEEEDQTILKKSPGRKIPRVIPQTRKSSDVKEMSDVEEEAKVEDKQIVDEDAEKSSDTKETNKEDENAFKSILEETSVPELPSLPGKEKEEQNFNSSKKSKHTDKKDDTEKSNGVLKHSKSQTTSDDKEISEKITTPKKRFVRNFEDFENFCNEQKNFDDTTVKEGNTLEVSKLKSQLMSKLTDSPVKSSTSSEDRKTEKIVELEVSTDSEVEMDVEKSQSTIEATDLVEDDTDLIEDNSKNLETNVLPEVQDNDKIDESIKLSNVENQIEVDNQINVEEGKISKENDNERNILINDKPLSIESSDETKAKMLMNISEICIDNTDNLSGLSTLAAVSELTGNFSYDTSNTTVDSPIVETPDDINKEILNEDSTENNVKPKKTEDVTETKSVVTLANFSLDFSDSNTDSDIVKNDITGEVVCDDNKQTVEEVRQVKEDSILDMSESNIEISSEPDLCKENATKEEIVDNNMTSVNNPVDTTCLSSDNGTTVVESVDETVEQISVKNSENTVESDITKISDTQSDIEDVLQDHQSNSSKLLNILTETKSPISKKQNSPTESVKTVTSASQKVQMVISSDSKGMSKKFDPKTSKFVIKSATSKVQIGTGSKSNKPIILSEKIIKPVVESENVSVKKVTSKRTYQDVEDIDTFIIQKSVKRTNLGDGDQQDIILTPKSESMKSIKSSPRVRGKPKIIEQTIIKAADVVTSVPVASASSDSQQLLDDSIFDINSMPIVLSDQILTPEGIENIPVVMSDLIPSSTAVTTTVQTLMSEKSHQTSPIKRGGAIQQVKILNKSKVNTSQPETVTKVNQNVLVKNIVPRGLAKNQKVYQTGGTKLLKNNPAVITTPGKPGKFIIIPSSTPSSSTGSKYTVGKRLQTVKNTVLSPSVSKSKMNQAVSNEPTGNKIMIVTNQQGVQSRVLLTPAQQQKLFTTKGVTSKITKNTAQSMKSNVIHSKSILTSKGTILSPVNSPTLVTSQKSPLVTQTVVTSKGQQLITTSSGQAMVTSEGQVLTPLTPQQFKTIKADAQKSGKKVQIQSQRVLLTDKPLGTPQKNKLLETKTKTVLIKGQGGVTKRIQSPITEGKNIYIQHGQKSGQVLLAGQQIQGTGKQVLITPKGQIMKNEGKVGIIKQMGDKMAQKVHSPKAPTTTKILTKPGTKTQMLINPPGKQKISSASVPPLSPISAQHKKSESIISQTTMKQNEQRYMKTTEIKEKPIETQTIQQPGEQKQPAQLIINDGTMNQVFTEGQLYAVPRETVDGQPQSYVLLTVDESGNLTPLNNEALMSLDPNLALTGEMGNVVLQFDQGTPEQTAENKLETLQTELPVSEQTYPAVSQSVVESSEHQQLLTMDGQHLLLQDQTIMAPSTTEQQLMIDSQQQDNLITNMDETQVVTSDSVPLEQETPMVSCSIDSSENGQQLIITGDPDMAQKFFVQLSEGNTDLNSLLSGAEGNIIINADGQQILLNTDPDNQILLMNNENIGLIQTSVEGDMSQSAMYVTQQAIKNQDILAAALADTDVFQQDATGEKLSANQTKVATSQSQLSPSNSLYPMNVSNVLETSLTLGSPIMTPLEVPSVNTKKINPNIESTLMSQVPSSLELPITITDPSISQTVSQQVMLGNDLQSNLDLPITITDSSISSIRSSEVNSPSFYSLPSLDENTEMEQKTVFSESSQSPVITSENLYSTSLTGSMSMPLLTEEPDMPVQQEQTVETEDMQHEEEIETSTQTAESDQNINLKEESSKNFSQSSKITADLQIPIEDELDLNPSDICNSLSEPPPGMFDKSTFSLSMSPRYLNNKEEDSSQDAAMSIHNKLSEKTVASSSENILHTETVCDLPILSESTDSTEKDSKEEFLSENILTSQSEKSELKLDETESTEEKKLELDQSEFIETNNENIQRDEENSCEIPLQPPIITKLSPNCDSPRLNVDENSHEILLPPALETNLSDNIETEENNKRESENENEGSNKRTKLSCD